MSMPVTRVFRLNKVPWNVRQWQLQSALSTFRHERKGNGGNVACLIISEYTIGLQPSHTIPHFNKSKHEFIINWLTNLAKHRQFRALKCINGKPKNQRITHLFVGMNLNATRIYYKEHTLVSWSFSTTPTSKVNPDQESQFINTIWLDGIGIGACLFLVCQAWFTLCLRG